MGIFDISVRVSRVGRRSDERLYSPRNQESAARKLIEQRGDDVGIVLVEKDVSGGKAAARRGIEKLVQRIEAGESNGIVVVDFSRMTREEPYAALRLVGRIHEAGGVILGVADHFDSSSEYGAAQAAMLATSAHAMLKVARERSRAGVERAIKSGTWIARRVPFGYSKDPESKRLQPDLGTAPLVVEAFERKARGESVTAVQRWLSSQGHEMGRSSVGHLLRNEAYLGVSRQGPVRNESAHKPLISRELFDRAQTARGVRPARTGVLASRAMLRSLVRCASCGSTMLVGWTQGSRGSDGQRIKLPAYYCTGHNRGGCPNRAYIRADDLDAYVEVFVLLALARDGDIVAEAVKRTDEVRQASMALRDAEHRRDQLLDDPALRQSLKVETYKRALVAADQDVEARRADFAIAQAQADATAAFESVMRQDWLMLPPDEKREILHGIIDHVLVQPANRKRLPVEARVAIVDREGTTLNVSPTDHMSMLDHPGLVSILSPDGFKDVAEYREALKERRSRMLRDASLAWAASVQKKNPGRVVRSHQK